MTRDTERAMARYAQVRLDGQVAFLRGEPFSANPFELGSIRCVYWSRGWRIGEDAARKLGVA